MNKKNKISRLLTDKKAVAPVVGTLLMLAMVLPLASGTMLYFTDMNQSMRDTFQTQNKVNIAMLGSQREFLNFLSNISWNFTGSEKNETEGPDINSTVPPGPEDPPIFVVNNSWYIWGHDKYIPVNYVVATNGTIIYPP